MEKGDQIIIPSFLEKLGVSLGKRRSCELVETASPCVRKALFHLENLQIILKQGEHPKAQWKNKNEKNITFLKKEDEGVVEDLKDEDPLQSEIIKQNEQKLGEPYHLKNHQEAPKEIFRQVTELILRLEDDRIKTEKSLTSERDRLNWLDKKLEEMMIKRMTTLPQAVQKEHEACARNIGELDWHVTNSVGKRKESLEALTEVQSVNNKLKNEIRYITNHCPLIEEKLELEKVAFDQVQALQEEADTELEHVQSKLSQVEQKYTENVETTELQIEKCDMELQFARNKLNSLKERYHNSSLMETTYHKKSFETQVKTVEMGKNYEQLSLEVAKYKKEEAIVTKISNELTEQICDLNETKNGLVKEIENVEIRTRKTQHTRGEELKKLEILHKSRVTQLKEIGDKNVNLKLDVENIDRTVRETEKKIARSRGETDRLIKEQMKNEEKIAKGMERIEMLKEKNLVIQVELDKEEAVSKEIEDTLKINAEVLRNEVDVEMKGRTDLEKKKEKNIKTLNKAKSDHMLKKVRVEKDLQENDEALTQVKSELHIAQTQHQQATQTMEDLSNEMGKLETEHAAMEAELTGKNERLVEMSIELKRQHERLETELEDMKEESEMLKPQIRDMKTSQLAMSKKMKETESNLKLVNAKLTEVRLDFVGKETIIALLKKQLEQAEERLHRRSQIHYKIMKNRHSVKEKLEKGNIRGVDFNMKAADNYRKVQSMHLDIKNGILKLYDEKLILETGMKDYKQLVEMQQKMNWALDRYHTNRANFNELNMHNFKKRTQENSDMVVEVQRGLENALHHVEDFLKSHIDGSAEEEVRNAGFDVLQKSYSSLNNYFKQKAPLPPVPQTPPIILGENVGSTPSNLFLLNAQNGSDFEIMK